MIFFRQLRSQGHTRAFAVREADERGWEIREEEDNRIVKRTRLDDWHHVENAMLRFMAEVVQLRSAGWIDVPTS